MGRCECLVLRWCFVVFERLIAGKVVASEATA